MIVFLIFWQYRIVKKFKTRKGKTLKLEKKISLRFLVVNLKFIRKHLFNLLVLLYLLYPYKATELEWAFSKMHLIKNKMLVKKFFSYYI